MFSALSHALTTLSRCYRAYSPSRSLGFTIAVRLTEQVNVVGQLLRRVLHLILQLLVLYLAHPFGESSPYRLKVSGWIVGPNHSKGMGSGRNNGVMVEAPEALHAILHLSMMTSGRVGLPSGRGAISGSTQSSTGVIPATTASNLSLCVRASCSSTSNCALTLRR